jgi:hypothetical protein
MSPACSGDQRQRRIAVYCYCRLGPVPTGSTGHPAILGRSRDFVEYTDIAEFLVAGFLAIVGRHRRHHG